MTSITHTESFGSVRSNLKKIIKWSEKLDTVRKDNKIVSHTLIKLKNICFVLLEGQLENLLHLFCHCLCKIKRTKFHHWQSETSKVVLEQGRRCLRRNELKTKTQFLLSNWFKMSKTNKYVVHKMNTIFFSVKFEKFYLTLIRGRLAINSLNCAIFFSICI